MPASKRPNKRAVLLRVGVSVVLLAAAAFVLARNWSVVHRSLELARGASIPWLVVSLLLVVVVYGLSAVCIGVLALHKLRLAETFLVELSTAFVNRLLPAALGSLGLVGYYLFKRKHTAAEATVVVSINNLVGITVHVTLLAGVLVFYPSVLHRFLDGRHFHLAWPVVSVLALVVLLVVMPAARRRAGRFLKNLLASVRKFRLHQLAAAALVAVCITTLSTTILFTTAHSLQIHIGLLQAFIVFSLGMLASTATPTPGGLVGAEAGLFAGFVAYGVSSPTAGAAVLVYRLITYWLPLVPGVFALLLARRQKLV